MSRILVIKLSALGDFVQATGPFAAIRRHHRDAHITLLTTPFFSALAERCPWFDQVWLDTRPGAGRLGAWLKLSRRLRRGGFDRVYDLQTSDRSAVYHRLMTFGHAGHPEWSGVASGCTHPHANPGRDRMHTLDRQAEQLRIAGILEVPPPNLDWLSAAIDELRPGRPFVLFVAGGAAHRPEKRWPAGCFAALANGLIARGLQPVLLGTDADVDANRAIMTACPSACDLTGRTDLGHIAALARASAGAVGNDTGPLHVIAAAGAPSLVLFSDASDPALCAPRAPGVGILVHTSLADLSPAEVEAHLRLR